jgi:formylglycine-generating enzyme
MRARAIHLGLLVGLFASWAVPTMAQSPKPGSTFRDCPTCPEVVVVPAGSFTMGSTPEELARAGIPEEQGARERPAHKVTIAKPFAIGRTELTVGEYRVFAAATGRKDSANCTAWSDTTKAWGPVADATWRNPGYAQTDQHPVGCLTIDDARAYTTWLTVRTGQRYRIPSEAEWEYVAKLGTPTDHSSTDICRFANVSDALRAEAHNGDINDATRFFKCRDGFVFASPVGSFPLDKLGLSDVIGNIWEWTEDCFIPHYDGAPTDGSVRWQQGCERMIVRGGGWYSRSWFVRAAGRSREALDYRSSTLGLRVVREID